jgi:hypothetical protein
MIKEIREQRDIAAQAINRLRQLASSVAESSQDPNQRAVARAYADAAMSALGEISSDAILEILQTSDADEFDV